jgi:hypothetical protein
MPDERAVDNEKQFDVLRGDEADVDRVSPRAERLPEITDEEAAAVRGELEWVGKPTRIGKVRAPVGRAGGGGHRDERNDGPGAREPCPDADGGDHGHWVRLDQLDEVPAIRRAGVLTRCLPISEAMPVSLSEPFYAAFVRAVAL